MTSAGVVNGSVVAALSDAVEEGYIRLGPKVTLFTNKQVNKAVVSSTFGSCKQASYSTSKTRRL